MARGFRIASAYVEVSARTDKAQMRRTADRVGRQGGGAYSSGFGAAAGAGMRRNADRAHEPMRDATGRFTNAGRQGGGAFAGGFGATAAAGMGSATRQAEEPLQGTRGRFTKQGQEGGRGFKTGVSAGLGGFAGALTPVTAAVGVVTGVLGGAVLGASKDFQAGMNGVRAITGATGKDFQDLEVLAKEMGSATQFSAGEAASAMEFLGMAGWDTKEIMEGLPDVLNLAASSGLDLADAADIASNIMSGFGIEATEAGRVADVLAAAAASANVDVGMLGESMKYAAPIASAAGWSLEETAAAVGLLGDAGMQGSMAGTGLNSILGTLADTSSSGGRKLAEFGVAAHDSAGEVRPLTEILADLSDEGADVADVLSIFGLEAGPKMQALLGRGSEGLQDLIDDLNNAEGAAQEMADIRMEGLEGSLKGAGSAMEGFMLAIGDMGILDGATRIVEMFGEGVRSLTGFLTEHGDTLKPIITAIGIFAGAVAGIIAVALGVKLAIAGVAAAFAILTSPVGLVVAGIAALVTGLVYAWKNSETFRDIVTGAWERIKEGWDALWEGALKPGLDALMGLWREHWPTIRATAEEVFDRVTEAWTNLWEGALKPGLEAVVDFVQENWPHIRDTAIDVFGHIQEKVEEIWPKIEEVFGKIQDFVSMVVGGLTDFWDDHGDKVMGVVDFLMTTVGGIFRGAFTLIGGIIKGAWSVISGIFSGALQVIGGILDFFIGLFTGNWERMWDGIKGIFSGVWTAIQGIFEGAVNILGGIVEGLIEAIKAPFLWLWDWLVGNSLVPDLVESVAEWFAKMRDWVRDRVRALVDRVVSFFTNLRDRASELIATMRDWVLARIAKMRDNFVSNVVNLRDRVVNLFTTLRDRARSIFDTVRDWITTRVRKLRDNVVGAVDTLRSKVIDAFERAKDGVKTAWDKLKNIAKAPVKFVIDTVYNNGLVPLWNKVADKVPGINPLDEMGMPRGFAKGGILPGQSSWRDGDDQIIRARRGEGIAISEAMAVPELRNELLTWNNIGVRGGTQALRRYASSGGRVASDPQAIAQGQPPLDGFSRGGIVGEWLSSAWDSIVGKVKDWATKPLNAIRDRISNRFGKGDDFEGIPWHAYKMVQEKVLDRFGKADEDHAASMEGGAAGWAGLENASQRLARAAQFARNQHGKPYVWGGAGPRGFDCSGFTGSIENSIRGVGPNFRRYSTHAFRGNSAPPGWRRNLDSPYTVGITHAGVGHTSGTLMGVNVESRGSRGVVVGSGARGTNNSLYTHRYGFAPVAGDDVAGTHDSGGVLLDGQAGINRKGEAELVVTAARLDRWATAAASGASTFTGDIHVHISAKDLKEMRDIREFFDRIQQTARQHGARTRTGAPR